MGPCDQFWACYSIKAHAAYKQLIQNSRALALGTHDRALVLDRPSNCGDRCFGCLFFLSHIGSLMVRQISRLNRKPCSTYHHRPFSTEICGVDVRGPPSYIIPEPSIVVERNEMPPHSHEDVFYPETPPLTHPGTPESTTPAALVL